MKFNYLAAILLGAALTANAQGYKDGIEYYKAGQYSNAITLLTRNLNNPDTDKALANYYLGQAWIVKDDNKKAKACFDAGIAANPNNPYNYVGLGYLDLMNGNERSAKENFDKAQKLGKKNTEILVDIARAYFDADPVKNTKEVEKYLTKASKDSKNQDPSIYIFKGDRLARQRDFNGAAAEYEQAIYWDNDNPEGYVKYANVYYYVVPDYAIKRLEELLQKQPNSALAQRELAEKYYNSGLYTKAAEQYGQYIKNPNHFTEDEARYAVLLFADGKYDQTIETAKKVLNSNPGDMDLTLDRIIIRSYVQLDKNDEALEACNVYFMKPSYEGRYNESDYTIYADLLNSKGETAKALEILEKGRKQFPDDASIVNRLAMTYSRQNNNSQAMDTFMEYIGMLENPTSNDYNRGSLFALYALDDVKDNQDLTNKYGNAGLSYLEKMDDPKNPTLMLRKAQILQQMSQNEVTDELAQAYRDLIQVLDSNPEYADPTSKSNQLRAYTAAYGNLANYYNKKGQKADATEATNNYKKYTDLYNQIQ